MADELNQDVVEGGNYEVLRARLQSLGDRLEAASEALNTKRQDTFGSTGLEILGQAHVRTENHCLPRDLVPVAGGALLGTEVFLGMKRLPAVGDVLTLHNLEGSEGAPAFHPAGDEAHTAFLHDPAFTDAFSDLVKIHKDAKLIQLRVTETKLLAVFQVGSTVHDVKVLQWALSTDGSVTFLDARGERANEFLPAHAFDWVPTTRDDHVLGRHPHVSVLDEVFVETIGGDLTVKIEDNTEDGQGIYAEPVDDPDQSLDDADIHYAELGSLILLSIRPYREEATRYLVYNKHDHSVVRLDAVGGSCVVLPEDHGILFPGGYMLRTGERRVFDAEASGFELLRRTEAPNGEDVLYTFYRRSDGVYALYPYNLVHKEIATPITGHGACLFEDGTLAVLRAGSEPGRLHAVQLWQTPFTSAERHHATPSDGSLISRIGNRDLVRGLSDALTLVRLIRNQSPTQGIYDALVAGCHRFADSHPWAHEAQLGDLRGICSEVREAAELVIDEFAKVQSLKREAQAALSELEAAHKKLMGEIRPSGLDRVDDFLQGMTRLRAHRGVLITRAEVRYIDTDRLGALEQETIERFDAVSQATVRFLLDEGAFAPLQADLQALQRDVEAAERTVELATPTERLDAVTEGVTLLSEVLAGLEVDDPTQKTALLDRVGEVVALSNRTRALLDGRRRSLAADEGRAEFGAQLKLYGQSVASALSLATTPEAASDQLSRLLLQLEELEARFGEFDAFLVELADKRQETYDALDARRQALIDANQRRISSVLQAAERILGGIERRARSFKDEAELSAWFAADPMVMKLRQLSEQLTELGDPVKGDEVITRLKTARTESLRSLRDKVELSGGGEGQIRLGQHQFSVHTQPLALTLVRHDDGLGLHLTGTDFLEPVGDEALLADRAFWDQAVVSETEAVYRAEYLAHALLSEAVRGEGELSIEALSAAVGSDEGLLPIVRAFATTRYDEGYDRGVHDADAAQILAALLALRAESGLLRFSTEARVLALLCWDRAKPGAAALWIARARALRALRTALGPATEERRLRDEIREVLLGFAPHVDPARAWAHHAAESAAELLLHVLGETEPGGQPTFTISPDAVALQQAFDRWALSQSVDLQGALEPLGDAWAERFAMHAAWLTTFAGAHPEPQRCFEPAHALEASAAALCQDRIELQIASASASARVEGLVGQHPRIADGTLTLQLADFESRLPRFAAERVPGFRAYQRRRSDFVEAQTDRLRIEAIKPKVMSAFVRNQLIDEVYLPLIGDNLAKQLGAAGDAARTDRMGLLLLISPPGYGKTTLMEYVANRLGLAFVKVDGPALGHEVTSLDPAQAPSATARQELEKLGLALEMGNNVMLYLDDIQHCDPAFLQRFIPLCDAQRRIEGVWRGESRTYDLRSKKFCVVMAGNPYTESGDRFQIPDMLANRADTYNLGDVLDGRQRQFSMSFLENALTSNPVLQPLASRPLSDLHTLVRIARGEPLATSTLSFEPSAVELSEIRSVLTHLFRCQEVVLQVNAAYIASAAMEDAYRTEPKFQLQGSYRNMNKMAEKILPAMTPQEVDALIGDHYRGEAQTLTTGAEANLLRLAELRGTLSEAQADRWREICETFARNKRMGDGSDPATRVSEALSEALSGVVAGLSELGRQLTPYEGIERLLAELQQLRHQLTQRSVHAIAAPTAPAIPAATTAAPTATPVPVANGGGHPVDPELFLQQVQAALSDRAPVSANGDATLASALSVIEALTRHMAQAARRRLPEDEHDELLEDLKRSVATAVAELAHGAS